MISAVSSGYGIQVVGGYGSLPYIAPNSTNPVTGMIRINGSNLEAFTGTRWLGLTEAAAHVELDDKVVEIIKWAERKMVEESRIKELAARYVPVADLKNSIDDLQAKLEMMMILVQDSEHQV